MPWERQANETSRQFASFQLYRDTHPTVRSLARVAEQLCQSTTYIERLSQQGEWVERVRRWDVARDRERQTRLLSRLEELEERHLQIADTTLKKISQRLENLDPKDIQVQHIPKLLSAIIEIQQMLFPPPAETRQPGQLMTATQIRLAIRAGLFSDPVAPPPSNPRLAAWIDGTLDDPNSAA